MSWRVYVAASAVLFGAHACGGDPFQALGPYPEGGTERDGDRDDSRADSGELDGDGGYRDSTADTVELGSDAGRSDSAVDAREAGSDVTRDADAPRDASPNDAAEAGALDVISSDRFASDALLDGAISDGPRYDGATDDGSSSDAGQAWCMGQSTAFCADFDTVTAWSDSWTTASVTPGALLDFNLVAFTSPRRSLHCKIPDGSGSEVASARLTKVLSTSLARSTLEFDLSVAGLGAGTGEWIVQVARLGHNGLNSGVALIVRAWENGA